MVPLAKAARRDKVSEAPLPTRICLAGVLTVFTDKSEPGYLLCKPLLHLTGPSMAKPGNLRSSHMLVSGTSTTKVRSRALGKGQLDGRRSQKDRVKSSE